MYCSNCGKKIDENSKFCLYCGVAVGSRTDVDKAAEGSAPSADFVDMKCKNCGGVMKLSGTDAAVHCPFCGSEELIIYGDAVEVQRIKSNTYKEVEYKKWEREDEKARRQKEENELAAFRKGGLGKASIVFAVICGFLAIVCFGNNRMYTGSTALIQTVLFIVSYIIRKTSVRKEMRMVSTVLAAVGFVLIIVFMIFVSKLTM